METYEYNITLHHGYKDITFGYNGTEAAWDAWTYFLTAIAGTNSCAELWDGVTGETIAEVGYEDTDNEKDSDW